MAKKKICLALQGGGSHGAFTWGVLDRLIEAVDHYEAYLHSQQRDEAKYRELLGEMLLEQQRIGGHRQALQPERLQPPQPRHQVLDVAAQLYGTDSRSPAEGRRF